MGNLEMDIRIELSLGVNETPCLLIVLLPLLF